MQNDYIVYLDVVLLINLLMDYLVLWATAKMGQFATGAARLLAGAACGTLYALAVLISLDQMLNALVVKFLISLIMLLITFRFHSPRYFARVFCYFYVVAFAMGGAVLGAIYLSSDNSIWAASVNGLLLSLNGIHYTWLLAALLTAIIVSRLAGIIRKNLLHSFYSLPVIITIENKPIAVKALVDTGNQLKDPITQKPVMIVEYQVLQKILPEEVQIFFEQPREPDVQQVMESIADSKWKKRFHLIPFSTIGRSNGMLLGIRPDEIIIVMQDKTIKVHDVLIGIYQKKLSGEGTYRALLHPEIVRYL